MKKSSFYLLFMNLFFLCINVHAQDFSLGVRGGVSVPNLTAGSDNSSPLSTGYSSRLGGDGGVFADFIFSDMFSIEPMAEYSSQGGKKDGMQAFTTPSALAAMFPPGQAPQYLYANYNSEAKLNYLLVPILAKFGWDFKAIPVRFYVDAGPFVGFLLSANQVTSGESAFYTTATTEQPMPGGEQSFNNTQNIKDQLHEMNVGFAGNVGLSYQFGHNSIFIEGGGNYGLINIQKEPQNGKNNTGAGTASIGYSYRFSK